MIPWYKRKLIASINCNDVNICVIYRGNLSGFRIAVMLDDSNRVEYTLQQKIPFITGWML